MEKTIPLEAKQDFLNKVTRTKPELALSEIIWNAFDADAKRVEVDFYGNEIGINQISISDDGIGIPLNKAPEFFSALGGSWKSSKRKTDQGRVIHGKNGQGRLKGFSLGNVVEWHICHENEPNAPESYGIRGNASNLSYFKIYKDESVNRTHCGVTVNIFEPLKQFQIFDPEVAIDKLCPIFGSYLSMYPDIKLVIQGRRIDVASLVSQKATKFLENQRIGDASFDVEIEIIEWNNAKSGRVVYWCTNDGFPITKMARQIRGISEFAFTVYAKSAGFEQDGIKDALELDDLNDNMQLISENIAKVVKRHFVERKIAKSSNLIAKWKEQQVYPYISNPETEIEVANRQLFDIVAINVAEAVDDYSKFDTESLRLQFSLLKEVLENNPADIKRILSEVINLPQDKRDDLVELLNQSSLSSIISASKEVSSRLHFLRGLEEIVYDEEERKKTKERSQLHRVLAVNTWVFGESFALTCDDESLNQVLKKHSALLETDVDLSTEVRAFDGKRGIVDLFLARSVPVNHDDELEFLIVELKAPKVKIGEKEISQIKKYAYAIIEDERFSSMKRVRWDFWVISSELNSFAKMELKNSKYEKDSIYEFDENGVQIKIKIKTWNTLIRECEFRYNFIKSQLGLSISSAAGLEYLKTKYDSIFSVPSIPEMDESPAPIE